nr:ATP:cob(I)alamin adenosyltransferase [Paracoccus mutanolyticus]
MVVLNKIYTRTGDKGDTALSNGERVRKDSLRVEAYGAVDELNATLGLARLYATGPLADRIATIQNDLFDLGADLSRPRMHEDAEAPYPVLRIIARTGAVTHQGDDVRRRQMKRQYARRDA